MGFTGGRCVRRWRRRCRPSSASRGRPAPKLGPYRELIDSWLDGDRDAPRKQRHTAKRIWERLRDEHAADVAERTVREYVHDRRAERGEGVQAFVPQVHGAGVEAEVDWGEAQVAMAGSAARVYLFHMRACHSGAAFAMAFPHCSQQAFLEAHVHAFDWFGGVFGLLRYDNLASAVKQVLRGRRGSRRTGSSRCARTISMSRSSRPRGSRAPTKRAASRERSGVSAAVTSSRSRTSPRSGS